MNFKEDGSLQVARSGKGELKCTEEWQNHYDCGDDLYVAVGKTGSLITGPMAPAFREFLNNTQVLIQDVPMPTSPITTSADVDVCRGYQFVDGAIQLTFADGNGRAFVSGSNGSIEFDNSVYTVIDFGHVARIPLNKHESINVYVCRDPRTEQVGLDFLWHYQP